MNRQKAIRSALWSATEHGGVAVISFITLMVAARFIGPQDFGVFAIALAVVELLGLVVTMWLRDALVQHQQLEARHLDSAWTATQALSVALFLLCIAAAPLFARYVPHPQSQAIFLLTALSIPFNGWSATLVADHQRQLEFKLLAGRSIVSRFLGSAIALVMVLGGYGIWSLVAQHLITSFVASVILWYGTAIKPRLRFRFDDISPFLRFGLLSLGSVFIAFASRRIFIVVSGISLGVQASGYLNMAFKVVDMLWNIVATAAGQVAFPVLSRLQDQPTKLKQAYQEASGLACAAFFPIFVGIAATAPILMPVLFGPQWGDSAFLVTVLALLTMIQAQKTVGVPMLKAAGFQGPITAGAAFELITLLSMIALIGCSTLSDALTIWVTRETLGVVLVMAMLRRHMKINLRSQLVGALRPAVAAATMAAALLGWMQVSPIASVGKTNLTVLAVLGCLVYISTLLMIDHSLRSRLGSLLVEATRTLKAR